jgi:RNA polymerase sigma-54 factor
MPFPTNSLQQVQKQTQQLVLAPQLRQSLKILQVQALDLRAAIQEELQSNPLLEELPMNTPSLEAEGSPDSPPSSNGDSDGSSESKDQVDRDVEILNQLDDDWRDFYSQNNRNSDFSQDALKRRQHFFDSLVSETSLQEHLMGQADLADCTAGERKSIEYLIGNLDNRGFLASPLSEIALFSGLSPDDLESAWAILKTFEPAGIGAANLNDCLLQQLKQNGKENSTAASIVRDHFDALLRRRIPDIARKLGLDVSEVEAAVEEIATLDPAPGRRFGEDNNRIIVPDVTVEKNGGDWIIVLNNDYIPKLRISNTYKEMIATGRLSRQEKEYIHEKMRSGKFLISSIEQRQQTIEKITREILRVQQDFFEEGVSKLRPLTMTQVADEVGVHETTVSRAIANKYILTPHGIFEFKFFFTPGYQSGNGESVSNKTIKDMIAHLVENESPRKPLSDQKIMEILAERNITIARRTVAKYREAMGILSTSLRRNYK